MKKCVYFAADGEKYPGRPSLELGFGFTAGGNWRQRQAPRGEVLAVDDRFPPNPAGLREALRFLRDWSGPILWDLERPPHPAFAALLRQVDPTRSVVPPAWRELPHGAVLVGPYLPGRSFPRWLAAQKARYGAVVLDGGPIRHRCAPGLPPLPWGGPLPEKGGLCAGAVCLCGRQAGAFFFWDSRETLLRRCEAAEVPSVILGPEWAAIPLRCAPQALPLCDLSRKDPGPPFPHFFEKTLDNPE